jgi:aminoglycoside phosphotransferase (APT) family kinase protein
MAGNPMPAAEVDVTADLVRRLLAGQHPDLAHLPVEFLANGWDNVMFRVGDELAARMPRRALGAEILVHEQRWLPLLAPRLPLSIPYPERTGHPAHGCPWPWSIVPYLPGEPAADTGSFDAPGAAIAVGGFLGARACGPAGLAARRPAPGQHPGPRRAGQRGDRLRRPHIR